ncbi:hypothetical protein ACFP1I_16710 [Dyadobacter subterraneus]|uniref:Uncharacterized protein n=1 Tax=Dyadobacter subterraneus TaxID=2773304 RepID=A0ABR9WHZ6_9BACT|nr:hypothetical protein [Dyadobacter subterraneus]MBE9465003.1 hypothetical protein [Dyadobacter subterraneus]
MNHLKIAASLILSLLFSSCSPDTSEDSIYNQLADKQAKAIYKVNNKEFYPSEGVFSAEINASDKLLSMTLVDQFDDRTIISFGGENWYVAVPVKKEVFADNQVNAGVKMGKLLDRKKMIGVGYVMSEGIVTLQEFSKDKVVIKVKGKVGKYSDFQEATEFFPMEGTVVCKKPTFQLMNITEEELFNAQKTSAKL